MGDEWWFGEWPDGVCSGVPSMTWLELVPIMVACLVWGRRWAGRRVCIMSDNMGVVGVWGRGWSGSPVIMALLRQLLFLTARLQFVLHIEYVPTRDNGAADALSRNDVGRFRLLRPGAAPAPVAVPSCVYHYLADPITNAHVLTGCRL